MSASARRRQLWLKLHRWLGLAALIFMLAFAITGSALVIPDALDTLINAKRYPASATGSFTPSDAFMTRAREALPAGDRISGIRVPAGQGAILVAGEASSPAPLNLGPPGRQQVWIDPQSLAVLDRQDGGGGFIWALHAIHGHMLLATGGRTVVAILGLALVAISAIGLWLWWPGMRSLVKGLKWRKAFSKSMNLHRQSGAVMALIMLLEGFTGAWIALPTLFGQLVEPGMAAAREGSEGPPATRPKANLSLSAEQAVTAAKQASGDANAALVRVFMPSESNHTWSIGLVAQGGAKTVRVDDKTGKASVLPPPPTSRSARVTQVMMNLHAGHYGPLWASIIFVSGIVLALLSATGLLLWLQGRKRLARRR